MRASVRGQRQERKQIKHRESRQRVKADRAAWAKQQPGGPWMEKTMEAVCLAEEQEDAGGRAQCMQARQQGCSSGKNKASSDSEGQG